MTIKPGSILECDQPGPNDGLVVAVIGYDSDFSVYEQPFPSLIKSKEEIAACGDKISEREARALFPELANLHYRP